MGALCHAGRRVEKVGRPLQSPDKSATPALQVQCKGSVMKTAAFPSLRVEPELRQAAVQVLQESESPSSFVEQSIRESIERRRMRSEIIARGLRSRDEARRTGAYVTADAAIGRLE
jgi:hypothetical protein